MNDHEQLIDAFYALAVFGLSVAHAYRRGYRNGRRERQLVNLAPRRDAKCYQRQP